MAKTCREKAREWVHVYAAGGATFAALPLPGATSAGLVAVETHLVSWIGRIYGEELSAKELALTTGTLGVASTGLKFVAMEAAGVVPVVGWLVKSAIAGSVIEGLGALIIKHFEDRYPGAIYTQGARIELAPHDSR